MKKYFRIMLVCILALSILFSFTACLKDDKDKKDDSIDIDAIADELEDIADDSDGELEFGDIKLFLGKKPVEKGFETYVELKGNVDECFELSHTSIDNVWCLVVAFEEKSDAKAAISDLEANLEEFYYTLVYESQKSILGSMADDEIILNQIESDSRDSARKAMPTTFAAERIENVIIFGDVKIVQTVFDAAEAAIEDEK